MLNGHEFNSSFRIIILRERLLLPKQRCCYTNNNRARVCCSKYASICVAFQTEFTPGTYFTKLPAFPMVTVHVELLM